MIQPQENQTQNGNFMVGLKDWVFWVFSQKMRRKGFCADPCLMKKSITGKLTYSELFFSAEKHGGNLKFSWLPNGWKSLYSLLVVVNYTLHLSLTCRGMIDALKGVEIHLVQLEFLLNLCCFMLLNQQFY